MNTQRFILLLGLMFPVALGAAEQLALEYTYDNSHNVSFSGMRGTISVGEFSDGRDADPAFITDDSLGDSGNQGGYAADKAITELVRQAFLEGFQHGEAKLAEHGQADMALQGELTRIDAEIVNRGGVDNIQITLRTAVQLVGNGRTIWQTNLFGRGRVPVEEGVIAAMHGALNRMVRELVSDNYFTMELQ